CVCGKRPLMTMKILIVDDSLFTRTIHRQTVENEGYLVVEAGGGQEAVEIFKKEKPDLVVTDLLMPDMDGMDLIREILTTDPTAKMVVCSADRKIEHIREAGKIGALGFLSKPIAAEDLNRLIEKLMG
ncbi:response regulator, partial [Desulfobulbus sp. N3]|nr:response regulator [Desulfobulbus sp. N3]